TLLRVKKNILRNYSKRRKQRMIELEKTLTSLEVAEMVGREHNEVLKDVRRIFGHLDDGNLPLVEYFIESTYKVGNGQERHTYLQNKIAVFSQQERPEKKEQNS